MGQLYMVNTTYKAWKYTYCGEPTISLHSYTVPLVKWSTRLLPVMRDPGLIPRGVLMWNWDSPVSVVSLHWWPWCDWSVWPRLRQASSLTVTRPSSRQCDNPTWSPTALLSWFHASCRSSFWFHNWHSWLLGGSPLKSPQSLWIHTQFHFSSGPQFASRHERPGFNPRGVLMWNQDSSVSVVLLQYQRKKR